MTGTMVPLLGWEKDIDYHILEARNRKYSSGFEVYISQGLSCNSMYVQLNVKSSLPKCKPLVAGP